MLINIGVGNENVLGDKVLEDSIMSSNVSLGERTKIGFNGYN